MAELSTPSSNVDRNYGQSKAGNWLLAVEFARKLKEDGVVSIVQNPGNLKTTIWNGAPKLTQILLSPTLSPVIFGAYTGIWAGFSDDVKVEDGVKGKYIIPWGRFFDMPSRPDIWNALKSKGEVGLYSGRAEEFWNWCDDQTRKHA